MLSHTLNSISLEVTKLHPRPPPPLIQGPTEPRFLLLTGAPYSADTQTIKNYVEGPAGSTVRRLISGHEPGKVIVEFDGMPGELTFLSISGVDFAQHVVGLLVLIYM